MLFYSKVVQKQDFYELNVQYNEINYLNLIREICYDLYRPYSRSIQNYLVLLATCFKDLFIVIYGYIFDVLKLRNQLYVINILVHQRFLSVSMALCALEVNNNFGIEKKIVSLTFFTNGLIWLYVTWSLKA